MQNLSFTGTWASLLAALQTLSPEQLAQHIEANTENRAFGDVSLEITQEAQYFDQGEWVGGESNVPEGERDYLTRDEAGHVYLNLN